MYVEGPPPYHAMNISCANPDRTKQDQQETLEAARDKKPMNKKGNKSEWN